MSERDKRWYIAIDLKSFYASVECVERGLDPLDTHLVVADKERTDKTICLAVSPSLKKHGTGPRPRLFEVVEKLREVNRNRRMQLPARRFLGSSFSEKELEEHPEMEIDYLVAKPRMALYIDYSTRIFDIYLRFVAPEDIHIYSIDEAFIDVTAYLKSYKTTPKNLAMAMIRQVLKETGITATVGIGTNLYLSKIAMDIVAKKMPPDKDGVRIAELDEISFRQKLWTHQPLTDFWQIGRGTENRLARYGIVTMGDLARCSITHEAELFDIFGVNAELLIDHAWGYEPVTIAHIKAYRPETHSLSQGQVLSEPYTFLRAHTVAMEMSESLALSLLDKRMVAPKVVLHITYDAASLRDPKVRAQYHGPIVMNHYGQPAPAHTHATFNLESPSSLISDISNAVETLFRVNVNPILLIRRINITAANIVREERIDPKGMVRQLTLFDNDYELNTLKIAKKNFKKERKIQETLLRIKHTFGKNAILRGLNFSEGATQRERNRQIGGHSE